MVAEADRLLSVFMRTPTDPDEPTSEPYRLMPPRRSELREALDAAAGRGQRDGTTADIANVILAGPDKISERTRRRRAWFSGTVQNAVGSSRRPSWR